MTVVERSSTRSRVVAIEETEAKVSDLIDAVDQICGPLQEAARWLEGHVDTAWVDTRKKGVQHHADPRTVLTYGIETQIGLLQRALDQLAEGTANEDR